MPKEATQQELQNLLDTFLLLNKESIVLWHDVDGRYAAALDHLNLPANCSLLQEQPNASFSLIDRINCGAVMERLVIYRQRPHRLDPNDWLADLEAFAPCFYPSIDFAQLQDELDETEADDPEALTASKAAPLISPIEQQEAVHAERYQGLTADWYALDEFRELIAQGEGTVEAGSIAEQRLAAATGYRLLKNCALKRNWPTLRGYFDSLFNDAVVPHSAIPTAVAADRTFQQYIYQRINNNELFDYDEESWITPEGLSNELDITATDLSNFAKGVLRLMQRDDLRYLTIPRLLSIASGLKILDYGMSIVFYESALRYEGFALSSCRWCGRYVFCSDSERGCSAGSFVSWLVSQDGSAETQELLGILNDGYGIYVPRSRLLETIKDTDLYYSKELDRVFISHNQFINEME